MRDSVCGNVQLSCWKVVIWKLLPDLRRPVQTLRKRDFMRRWTMRFWLFGTKLQAYAFFLSSAVLANTCFCVVVGGQTWIEETPVTTLYSARLDPVSLP